MEVPNRIELTLREWRHSSSRHRIIAAPSFNGRTADSGSAYRGSNPWGAAKSFQAHPFIEEIRLIHSKLESYLSKWSRNGLGHVTLVCTRIAPFLLHSVVVVGEGFDAKH